MPVPLTQLVDEAFKEAHKHQPAKIGACCARRTQPTDLLSGERSALRHALSESIAQRHPGDTAEAKVRVRTTTDNDGHGHGWVHIDVTDNGTVFSRRKRRKKVPTPFFTTSHRRLGSASVSPANNGSSPGPAEPWRDARSARNRSHFPSDGASS